MQTEQQLRSMHWDVAKLLEMGVSEEFVSQMTPTQIRDTLKGLLYLHAKYVDNASGDSYGTA